MDILQNHYNEYNDLEPLERLHELAVMLDDIGELLPPPDGSPLDCYKTCAAIANVLGEGLTSRDVALTLMPEVEGLCVEWPDEQQQYEGIDENQAWEEFTDLVTDGHMQDAAVLFQTYPQAMNEREEGFMTVPMRGLYWIVDSGNVERLWEYLKWFHTHVEYDNAQFNNLIFGTANDNEDDRMYEALVFAGFEPPPENHINQP